MPTDIHSIFNDQHDPNAKAYIGIEVVRPPSNLLECEEKEAVTAVEGKEVQSIEKESVSRTSYTIRRILEPGPQPRPRNASASRRLSRKCYILCAIAVVIALAAIAVPIAITLSRKHDSHDGIGQTSEPTSSAIPTASSTTALLGTRLTTMDPRTGGDIMLFYQVQSNGLRYISMSPQRIWQGSTSLPVDDAVQRTPLATASTIINGSTYWWLFYVDMNRHIQSIYSVHDATSWQKGAIGSLGYEVSTKANIIFILSRGRKYDKKSNDLNGGLSLYATGPDEIIHEYVFNDADWSWEDAFTFPITQGSGGGGEASIWSRDSFAYLFTSISTAGNENQAITLWWRDYAGTVENKANAWHQGPTSPTLAARQGGMCGQYAFAFQGADGAIRGSNFTQLDRPSLTRWDTVYDITGNESVLEGTGLSCWYFFPNTTMFHVFYQIKQKSAIREAIRDWGPDNATVPGIWRFRDVPIY